MGLFHTSTRTWWPLDTLRKICRTQRVEHLIYTSSYFLQEFIISCKNYGQVLNSLLLSTFQKESKYLSMYGRFKQHSVMQEKHMLRSYIKH